MPAGQARARGGRLHDSRHLLRACHGAASLAPLQGGGVARLERRTATPRAWQVAGHGGQIMRNLPNESRAYWPDGAYAPRDPGGTMADRQGWCMGNHDKRQSCLRDLHVARPDGGRETRFSFQFLTRARARRPAPRTPSPLPSPRTRRHPAPRPIATLPVGCLALHRRPPPSPSTVALHPRPPPSPSTLALYPPPSTLAVELHVGARPLGQADERPAA